MNITNPVYTSMSDTSYYCELTETGVWVCQNFIKYDYPISTLIAGFCVGMGVLIAFILICTMINLLIGD